MAKVDVTQTLPQSLRLFEERLTFAVRSVPLLQQEAS
jgi:hypothetical protein